MNNQDLCASERDQMKSVFIKERRDNLGKRIEQANVEAETIVKELQTSKERLEKFQEPEYFKFLHFYALNLYTR